MVGPFKTWTTWIRLSRTERRMNARVFSSFHLKFIPRSLPIVTIFTSARKNPTAIVKMPHYSPISLKRINLFGLHVRHFFFPLSLSIIGIIHFDSYRDVLAELRPHLCLFWKSFFQICSQKANEKITHFISRNTIHGIILLFLQTHLAVSFFIKLFLFTKAFTKRFLIKLSVFVRFDERYCEHSTRKDIKAFALRNTNGFCKFSPTRSYRLSWYDEGRRRSDSTRLYSSI